MLRLLGAALALLVLSSPASAHDDYAWVRDPVFRTATGAHCCSEQHCRPAAPGELVPIPGGWRHVPTQTEIHDDKPGIYQTRDPAGRLFGCVMGGGAGLCHGGAGHMIALTSIQKRVYDALALATGGGAHEFTGRLDVAIATRSAVNHTLSQLELIGIVRMAPAGRVRRFRLLVPPAEVTIASRAEIVRARLAGKCGREPRPVDRGDFLRRAAEVGLPRFENGRRTVSLGRHAPPRHDARAL